MKSMAFQWIADIAIIVYAVRDSITIAFALHCIDSTAQSLALFRLHIDFMLVYIIALTKIDSILLNARTENARPKTQ